MKIDGEARRFDVYFHDEARAESWTVYAADDAVSRRLTKFKAGDNIVLSGRLSVAPYKRDDWYYGPIRRLCDAIVERCSK